MNLQIFLSLVFTTLFSFSAYGVVDEYMAPNIHFSAEIVNHNQEMNDSSEYENQWNKNDTSRDIASKQKKLSQDHYVPMPDENYRWESKKKVIIPTTQQAEQEILEIDYDGRNPASILVPRDHRMQHWHISK